jgi:hypothetical protein
VKLGEAKMPPSKERAEALSSAELSEKRVGLPGGVDAAGSSPTCVNAAVRRPRSTVRASVPQECESSGKHRRHPVPRGSGPPMIFALSRSRHETSEQESDSSDSSEEEKSNRTASDWFQSDEWQECAQGLWEATVQEELDQVGYAGEPQGSATAEADLRQRICRVRQGVMDVALRCESDAESEDRALEQIWEHFRQEDEQQQQQRYSEFLTECWAMNWGEGHGVPLSQWKPV